MKSQKSCLYYLLILISIISLCGCTRSALPPESSQTVESFRASDVPAESKDAELPLQPMGTPEETQAAFDEFTNGIFRDELIGSPLSLHCIVRYPENYGIIDPEMTLGEFSESSLKKSAQEVNRTLTALKSFNTAQLTSDQLFTYKMLLDYLETEQLSEGMELYNQPLSPVIGTQAQLPILLAEYTFSEKKDVDHYLALLSDTDTYYKQLADFEKVRADAGLAPSDVTLDRIIQSCKNYMIRPENSFLTETFDDKLEDVIPALTDEEKKEYKSKHTVVLKDHFIPAYANLADAMEALKGTGTNQNGLYHYEKGKKYYEYLVASRTGTSSAIPELRKRIEKQVGQDMAEITLLAQNNPDLLSEAAAYSFSLTDPIQILESLKEECKEDFPELSNSTFTVKHVPKALESSLSPAFFLTPPIDFYEKGTIYINGLSEQTDSGLYTTLAHEGYPGHLYQTLYFSQKDSSPIRHILGSNGYAEGWGTYAEIYSYSFDNGLPEDVKKLLAHNQASTLALYALLDIRIHYEGWNLAKTGAFLNSYYGIKDEEVIKEIFEAIIDNPANYLTYYAGYLEFLTMSNTAQESLGNRCNPKSFHKFLLGMEGASFRVIEPYFKTWLLTFDVNQ